MNPIRITSEKGGLVARDSLLLAFFCKRPAAELLASFEAVFDRWLTQTPPEAKLWACIGENADTYKPFTTRSMTRLRAEFDPRKVHLRDVNGLDLGGPQQINPDYHFTFNASREISPDALETNLLEVRLPSELAAPETLSSFLDFARFVAEHLPYDSGYGSLALTWGVDSQEYEFSLAVRGLAARHPGFDMPDNQAVKYRLDKQSRGAYWLTFVGPDALAKLGGSDALRAKLDPAIGMEQVGVGVMLRAGERPEPGDVNRAERLPLVRSLAKVLEPVCKFGSVGLDNLFVDVEARERWERRHLD